MKPISIQTQTIAGAEYRTIKGWAPKGFDAEAYRSQVESYGFELVRLEKLSGDATGNVWDVVLAA